MTGPRNFDQLRREFEPGVDFEIRQVEVPGARAVIIAPHGGAIEPDTTELALAIAGSDHSFYSLVGRRSRGNSELHLTSHLFDEPQCIDLLSRHERVLAIHGCAGQKSAFVGGLDGDLADIIHTALLNVAVISHRHDHQFPGTHPRNICNRGKYRRGVQLELTRDLRLGASAAEIALAVRRALLVPA